jgi:1-acyl-sn-glycerol-3-phosphate acyltransferase
MAAREVARIARETIDVAFERQKSGDSLLIFVEGTRSRGGGMQRALPAVSRYFEYPDAFLVPLGIRGSERLLPVEQEKVHRATVNVRVGKPVSAARVFELSQQSRRCVVDVMGVLIAKLLPAQYQGAYGGNAEDLGEARRIAEQLERE